MGWVGFLQSYPSCLISKTHQAPFKHTITHLDDFISLRYYSYPQLLFLSLLPQQCKFCIYSLATTSWHLNEHTLNKHIQCLECLHLDLLEAYK